MNLELYKFDPCLIDYNKQQPKDLEKSLGIFDIYFYCFIFALISFN